MLDEYEIIEESEIPKDLTDSKMIDLAKELGEEYEWFEDSRKVLTHKIWPECDKAMKCIRQDLTQAIPTIKLIDNSMLGESDLRDAIKRFRNQVLSQLCPSDESFLRPAPLNDEDDEDTLQRLQDYLISLNERAGLRATMEPVLDQLAVRGTTGLGVAWKSKRTVHRIAKGMETVLDALGNEMQPVDENGEPITAKGEKAKYWKPVFSGPKIFPVDMYRLLFDPQAEQFVDDDIATVYITFHSPNQLKRMKDGEGNNLYDQKSLEGVRIYTYAEYYAENPQAIESTKIMGIDPSLDKYDNEIIPVYLCHKQVRETEDDDVYVDKFFYIARCEEDDWRVIRVHDNPSDTGEKPFYFTQCDRWLNNPYGEGLAEKSLSAWKAKNLIAALGLNAKVLSILPPMGRFTGVVKDDRAIKFGPLAMNDLVWRPGIGKDWMAPLPLNPNGAIIAMQEERQYSEKIISQTGTSSAPNTSDPGKSLGKSKTATEIRQTTTDGYLAQQVMVDRLQTDIMHPVQQHLYSLARQHYTEDQRYSVRTADGDIRTGKITAEELDRDRTIEIMGKRGLANQAHQIDMLLKALEILLKTPNVQQVMPNLPIVMQDILFKLLPLLTVPMKPEYKIPPAQLVAQDPQAMIMSVQAALQNPEARAMIIEILMESPEAQQLMQQGAELLNQHREQGQSEGHHAAKIDQQVDAVIKAPPAPPPGVNA